MDNTLDKLFWQSMSWIPVLSPHEVDQYRWSGRHPIAELEVLSRDLSGDVAGENIRVRTRHIIAVSNETDLVFASRFNTLTIMRNALPTNRTVVSDRLHPTKLSEIVLSPMLSANTTDIQMFEVKLSITSIRYSPSLGCMLVATMYDVYKLVLVNDRYIMSLLYSEDEPILDVCGYDDDVYVLKATKLKRSYEEILDMEDIWRNSDASMVRMLIHNEVFIIMEPTAIHIVSPASQKMACSIPSQSLIFTDRFLGMDLISDDLCCVISTRHILIYSLHDNSLDLKYSFLHFVNDASAAHLGKDDEEKHFVSVMSDEKCSIFILPNGFCNNFMTNFMIPNNVFKSCAIKKCILDKYGYLCLKSANRKYVTDRIGAPVTDSIRLSEKMTLILTENNDLFCNHFVPNVSEVWERWLSKLEDIHSEYETKSFNLLPSLRFPELRRNLSLPPPDIMVPKDDWLNSVTEKHVENLIKSWEWT